MRASDRLVLASTVAVLLISFTARPLTTDSSYLGLSWFVVLVLAATTVGLRRARLTAGFVFASQLALLAVLLFVVSSFAPSRGEPWYAHYVDLWQQGLYHMQTQAAPMDADAGVKIIFVSVIAAIFVLTDLLVSGLDRPAWGIAPPAAAFVVPALGLGIDTGIGPFACLSLGYLGILVADGLNRTGRWTRGLSRDSADGFGTATPMVWRAAGLIGVPALVLTAVLGVALPTLALPGLGIGNGGGGGGPLQLTDPTLDLRRNLNQGADTVVLRYTTDKPGGLYLFDTINRTRTSKLLAVKLLQDWRLTRVIDTELHSWALFIKPAELEEILHRHGLRLDEITGLGPRANKASLLWNFTRARRGRITFGRLSQLMDVGQVKGTAVSYMGCATKTV